MKGILVFTGVLLSACLCAGFAQAADEESEEKEARYVLYQVAIDEKPRLLLLDTQKGRIWLHYKRQGGVAGDQDIFRGVTVEGLAYTPGESKSFDTQIEEWHAKDFIDKDLKGFREQMESEYFYEMDLKKAKELNYELEILKKAEEKKQ